MTVTTTHNRLAYTAGAGQTVFPYDFLVLAAAALLVYVDGVLQSAATYTVSGVGVGSGGNVTLDTPLVGGEAVVLLRATDRTQQVNLVEGAKLPAESTETIFDQAYLLAQDLAERATRAVSVPVTSAAATTPLALPDPALAANQGKALFIKSDGTLETRTILPTDLASPITAKGDLIRGDASGAPEKVPVGTTGQVLTVAAGQAVWGAGTPITTEGDLVQGGTAGAPERLGIGATGEVLTVVAGKGAWAAGGLPRSYLAGLGTSLNGTDPTHDIDVAVGEARDSTHATDLTLASVLTKQIDAAWAVGTNAGGMDTGAVGPNTWYALWLIKRSDTGVVDALFSTSGSAPTMPANYDQKRRLWWHLTDGSSLIIPQTQIGDEGLWTTPILDLSGDLTEAATLRTLSVPPIGCLARCNVGLDTVAGQAMVYLSTPAQTAGTPSGGAAPLATYINANSAANVAGPILLQTNASSQIRTEVAGGTLDGNGLSLATLGWTDRRGRDA